MNLEEVFGDIYKRQIWGDGSELAPLSGSGSTRVNALPYIDFVDSFIEKNKIDSVLDFGHGDWQMWDENSFNTVDYLGVDIAKNFSVTIQAKLGNSKRRFEYFDVMENMLPSADLLLSKDVLQHLPGLTIQTFLTQMKSFKFAIICNDIYVKRSLISDFRDILSIRNRIRLLLDLKFPILPSREKNNSEILAGNFSGIDLEKVPYSIILENFQILAIKDYDGPKRSGIKKRIYLFSRK